MPKTAALRAAVFQLSAKNLKEGGCSNTPPARRGLKAMDNLIPLFSPSDTAIPVICLIHKFSGLVSPWQGSKRCPAGCTHPGLALLGPESASRDHPAFRGYLIREIYLGGNPLEEIVLQRSPPPADQARPLPPPQPIILEPCNGHCWPKMFQFLQKKQTNMRILVM